jgi:hypothetical protein
MSPLLVVIVSLGVAGLSLSEGVVLIGCYGLTIVSGVGSIYEQLLHVGVVLLLAFQMELNVTLGHLLVQIRNRYSFMAILFN